MKMGQKLKMAWKHRMLSQERFSRAVGVSRATISHLENNTDAVTTTQILRKLARVLGIDAADFFTPQV